MEILNRSTASAHRAADQALAGTLPAAQWLWLKEGETALGVKLVECLAFVLAAGLLISVMR